MITQKFQDAFFLNHGVKKLRILAITVSCYQHSRQLYFKKKY